MKQDRFGVINHAGGRRFEITAPYSDWIDYATQALYAHDAFVNLLAACEAMPFGQRPHEQMNAVKDILNSCRK